MKKCDRGRKEQHHTRKLWLLKIEEEVKTEVPRIGRNRGRGRSRGGGPRASTVGSRAVPKELLTFLKRQRGSRWCSTEEDTGQQEHLGDRDK